VKRKRIRRPHSGQAIGHDQVRDPLDGLPRQAELAGVCGRPSSDRARCPEHLQRALDWPTGRASCAAARRVDAKNERIAALAQRDRSRA
jgi:hypothetical protein